MKIQEPTLNFLTGREFSNGVSMSLSEAKAPPENRYEYFRQMVKGKNVLHIGCTDHLPNIDSKRADGTWLHEILVHSAARCAGIDIDRAACEHVKKLGFKDVHCMDMIQDELPTEIKNSKFDYLILGEMIIQVDNPVAFLQAVRSKFAGIVEKAIITSPNALRIQNLVNALRGVESIHCDHRYWFTPFTLAKVMICSGFTDLEIDSVWYSPLTNSPSSWLKRWAGKRSPLMRDCLIATARL